MTLFHHPIAAVISNATLGASLLRTRLSAGVLMAALSASALTAQAESAATGQGQNTRLYGDGPIEPWQVIVENPEEQISLKGDSAVLPKGDARAQILNNSSGEGAQKNALEFNWKDARYAGLSFTTAEAMNLTAYLKAGALALDVKVDELAKGGASFKLQCKQEGCDRQVPFTLKARELVGKGWQKIYIPLTCFKQEHDDFTKVATPFGLAAGGSGTLQLANIELLMSIPQPLNATHASVLPCPDYRTQSVTPEPLSEWWALDWWLPRHQQKLADAKAALAQGKKIDVVMIGDSITQGWETDGLASWNKYLAPRNAFNLGFSGDRTENVLWRLHQGEVEGMNPKVAVLMIGTNNTGHRRENPETTAAGIKKILDELATRLPNSKILLLAIFPRDAKPDGELRIINEKTNNLIKHYADNKRVFFANINLAFLTDNGVLEEKVMPDFLHPKAEGYELFAKALLPKLDALLE